MLGAVRNVTLPVPVIAAGGIGCLLAGALTGYVLAPHSSAHDTATVASFDTKTSVLCLAGGSIKDEKDHDADGRLCGVLRRSDGMSAPKVGQKFRYVIVRTSGTVHGKTQHQTLIYGTVVA